MKYMSLRAKNYKKFNCLGPSCEDNCCTKWNIDIDKKTYKKCMNIKDREYKRKFKKAIVKDEKGYRIKYDETGYCPLLDEVGLCSMHKNYGEEYLSNVCKKYPRRDSIIEDYYEETLELSCPETVRLMLFDENIMEFEQVEISKKENSINGKQIKRDYGYIEKHYWDIRSFLIEILQNRELKLWERLSFGGMFLKIAEENIKEKQYEDNLELINDYRSLSGNSLEVKKFIKEFLKIDDNIKKRLKYSSYEIFKTGFDDGKIKIYGSDIFIKDEEELEKIYQKYVKSYIEKKEYIFENYMVNYLFKNVFPYSQFNEYSLTELYSIMILEFNIIKTYIACAAKQEGKLTDEIIVKVIYTYVKRVNHSKMKIDFDKIMRDGNYLDYGVISQIIRD